MNQLTPIETVTCFAVIIACAAIIFKAFQHPITEFFKAVNPFSVYYRNRKLRNRVEDLEMRVYDMRQDIRLLDKKTKNTRTSKK